MITNFIIITGCRYTEDPKTEQDPTKDVYAVGDERGNDKANTKILKNSILTNLTDRTKDPFCYSVFVK